MKLTLIHKTAVGILVALAAVLGLSLGSSTASARVDSGDYAMTTHGFAGTVDHGSAIVRGDSAVINGQHYQVTQTGPGGFIELSGIPGWSRITLVPKGSGYTGQLWTLGLSVGTVDLDRR